MVNPWEEIARPKNDLNARRVDHSHPLNLFWAKDQLERYLLVIEINGDVLPEHAEMPSFEGIDIASILADNPGQANRLVLMLREQSEWELFYAICCDLISATATDETKGESVQIIVRRLNRWHEFLKNKRRKHLPEETIKGLIGELLYLKDHLIPIFGMESSISFWQGPKGLPQDFNINDTAIEVKAQSGGTTPTIKINSVDQLCTQLSAMYLHVITLGKSTKDTEGSFSLPTLISDIRFSLEGSSIEARELFEDLLLDYGYLDLDIYYSYNYIFIEEKTFEVRDQFPRICRDIVPDGITKMSYHISIAECTPYKDMPTWME